MQAAGSRRRDVTAMTAPHRRCAAPCRRPIRSMRSGDPHSRPEPDGRRDGRRQTCRRARRGFSQRSREASPDAAAALDRVCCGGDRRRGHRSRGRGHTWPAEQPEGAAAEQCGGVIHSDGSLHDAVLVGQSPSVITFAAGSLWVANGGTNTVMRIDLRAHIVVREVAVGADPVAIAATGSDVWVVNASDRTANRINANVNRVVGKPIKVGNQPGAIAAGPRGVWVANSGDDTVQHIDPDSSEADPAIAVGGGPDGVLAVDADSVWVANGLDGPVSRLDVRTGAVRAQIHVGIGPAGLAFMDGAVWVTNSLEQSLSRIDPGSRAVDTIRDVGDGPTAVAGDGRFLWVAASHAATVTRIEPRSRNVRRFGIGASPTAITTVGSSVYVASRAFAVAGHRGGTLTVGNDKLPGTSNGIDPANLYYYWTSAAECFVYDGLIAYRAADGAAGYTFVPDLAARLPEVSPDRKT